MNTHNLSLKEQTVQSTPTSVSLYPFATSSSWTIYTQCEANATVSRTDTEPRSNATMWTQYRLYDAPSAGSLQGFDPLWGDRHQSGWCCLCKHCLCKHCLCREPAQQDGNANFWYEACSKKKRTYIDSKMLSDSSAMFSQHSKRKALLQKDPGFVFVF